MREMRQRVRIANTNNQRPRTMNKPRLKISDIKSILVTEKMAEAILIGLSAADHESIGFQEETNAIWCELNRHYPNLCEKYKDLKTAQLDKNAVTRVASIFNSAKTIRDKARE